MARAQSLCERGRFGSADAPRHVLGALGGLRLVLKHTFLECEACEAMPRPHCSELAATPPRPRVRSGCSELGTPPKLPRRASPGRRAKEARLGRALRAVGEDEQTTIVLKNLPFRCPNAHVVELLDSHGLAGTYDLIYVPTNFKTWESYGYAFVNMVSPVKAQEAIQCLRGFEGWRALIERSLEVCYCEALQGLRANIERYRNSPVMHESVPEEYKPLYFKHGRRLPFPRPTRCLRAPRCRHAKARPEDSS